MIRHFIGDDHILDMSSEKMQLPYLRKVDQKSLHRLDEGVDSIPLLPLMDSRLSSRVRLEEYLVSVELPQIPPNSQSSK